MLEGVRAGPVGLWGLLVAPFAGVSPSLLGLPFISPLPLRVRVAGVKLLEGTRVSNERENGEVWLVL